MKKVIRLTERDLTRIVKRVINEDIQNNDLYLTINDALKNTNSSDEEKIHVLKYILKQMEGDGIITKGKVRKFWNMNEMEESRNTWEDDTDNMVNETSLMNRFQYYKEIRDAKKQAKETDECMCVVETIVSGVIVKPCSDLTPTEEEHLIFNTNNCDTFDGTY